jgi:hypothetical protein
MDNKYTNRAFREITQRPDRGAGCWLSFSLCISGREICELRDVAADINPTLRIEGVVDIRQQCWLVTTELDNGIVRSVSPQVQVSKNPHAISATLAYQALEYGRETYIQVHSDVSTKKDKIYIIKPQAFVDDSVESNSIEIYATVFKGSGRRQTDLDKYIRCTLSSATPLKPR